MRLRGPMPFGVLAFTAAYLAVATLFAWRTGNVEFLFYIVVVVVLASVVAVVHLRAVLSRGALWCLSIWGLAHMAGGLAAVPASWPIEGSKAVLYSLWIVPGLLKYDHVVHAFGFGVTTWVCWQGLGSLAGGIRPTLGPLVLCGAAGLGFGALNEVVEFVAVLVVPETNVGGYLNTGWDLVANTAGATIALLWIRIRSRYSDALRPGAS